MNVKYAVEAGTAVKLPSEPCTVIACVAPTGMNAADGETLIGGSVGVGVGDGEPEGVSDAPGNGDAPGDGDSPGEPLGVGESAGCANGVGVTPGSGVDCARAEIVLLIAAMTINATSSSASGRNVRRSSPLPPELPPMQGVFYSPRSGRAP